MTDQPQPREELFYVAPTEPPASRKPPPNTVGIIGWMRSNLFSSWVNGIATVLMLALLVWFVGNTLDWAIRSAGWTVVNNNLRLLLVGQYSDDQLWRVTLVSVTLVALSGMSLGFWAEVSRPIFVTIIITLAVMVLIPVISQQFAPPPIRSMVAPQSGTFIMRFVGDTGDNVRVRVEQLTNANADPEDNDFNGFIETSPGESARNLWNDIKQGRRADTLDLTPYDLAFNVELLNASGEVIASLDSDPADPNTSFNFTLPESGWYAVRTVPDEANSEGYAWVRMDGVRSFTTRTVDVERRNKRYGEPPAFECPEGGDACVTEAAQRVLRYEGLRQGFDYLTIQLAPFLRDIIIPTLISAAIALAGGVVGYFMGRQSKKIKGATNLILLSSWIIFMPLSFIILRGFQGFGLLPYEASSSWGGLLLTLVLTAMPIALSFPIGILLALGRANKQLVMVSTFSTVFIEVVRGVPLITILFFAKLVLPFFISASSNIEMAVRMLIGLTLFTAAYVAEVVRGGLQIVPQGQTEAAQALGLQPAYITWLIKLPQAIRAVIPALMSQFVSLFKDTTLVSIVGLFELLGIVELIVNGQQQYRPYQREAYLFVAVIYFIVSLVMASISRRLENTGVGAARQ